MPAANNFQDKKAVKKSRHDTNSTDSAMNNDKKIHVSRIPTFFDEDAVKRLLEEKLGPKTVEEVVLIYKRPEQEDEDDNIDNKAPTKHQGEEPDVPTEHRGFGFVTFSSAQAHQQALDLESVRGGRTATSSKKHTLYLRPYVDTTSDSTTAASHVQVCYLWAKHRCPYGNDCKFLHQGDGGCVELSSPNESKDKAKKKQKCFAFKKGKCRRGAECPFSHDVGVVENQDNNETATKAKTTTKSSTTAKKERPDSEKDCINWKTKGKCRKGDQCPYKHDPTVREAALSKQQQKLQQQQKVEQQQKRKRQEEQDVADNQQSKQDHIHKKSKQPLWVRVFGMNYDTTLEDIRAFLESCGRIVQVEFPTFADSGRSKGYCGVLFQSPKAVAKALELDGHELQGRWLRIQAGKMLLEQWEDREQQQQHQHQQSLKQE